MSDKKNYLNTILCLFLFIFANTEAFAEETKKNASSTTTNVKKVIKKFTDWSFICEDTADAKSNNSTKQCYIAQTIADENKNFVAEFRFGYFGGNELKMLQILPFGINLQSGTAFINNKKIVMSGKFTTCQNFGCIAVVEKVTAEDLKNIYSVSAKDNVLGIISAVDGKQINLIFSNKGLKEAIKYFESNNKK